MSFCFATCVCPSACDTVRALWWRLKIDTQRLQNRSSEGSKSSQDRPGTSRSGPERPKSIPTASQERPRASQERSKSVQERSKRLRRALQEASKRPSEGFRVEDAIRTPFGTHFWLPKVSSGPKKKLKSLQLSVILVVSPFSAWTAFGLHFWTLLGPFWEGIWPPRWLKSVSSAPLGRPRADQD